MKPKIRIITKEFVAEAELLPERPKTCEGILRALPFEAEVEIWKEEVYFEIPVKIPPENPTPNATAGDVAYWPEGPGFCIFFGRSQPLSPVNTFARIGEGVEKFRRVRSGDWVRVEASER
ncbi:MAG: cyclophilin-like fold protein [Candidatus Hadarchaeales archaeon]